ncbi:MAG: apolipoprotein N-acyltransferase, partial [Rhodospirillaceae bacterium]|nr:apolipoprotein N-acyltransferase [Rhodospirillaceae bacterium]
MSLSSMAEFFSDLTGRQRLLASWLAGCIAALALPPLYLAPSLIIAFTALVWISASVTRKRTAFAIGWWFG